MEERVDENRWKEEKCRREYGGWNQSEMGKGMVERRIGSSKKDR